MRHDIWNSVLVFWAEGDLWPTKAVLAVSTAQAARHHAVGDWLSCDIDRRARVALRMPYVALPVDAHLLT